MGKTPLSPFFSEVWADGVLRWVKRSAGKFVRIISDYSSNFEIWSDGNARTVIRDRRGRFVKWRLEPPPIYEEEEEEVEEELPPEKDIFRITVALRGVKRNEYFNIVAHYYGSSESDATAHIPELMKMILKKMYSVAGYHHASEAAGEDFRISDVYVMRYDEDLIGTTEMEEEWEL